MVEREALLLQIGGQQWQVLGHVAVDVDDRVAEAASDLGCCRHPV
jgi:hypothetical protein